jgi:hypothetical protein
MQHLLAKARSFDDAAVSNYEPDANDVKALVAEAQRRLATDVARSSTAACASLRCVVIPFSVAL